VIPTGVELLAFDAAPFGFVAFQHVQRQATQRGQILRREPARAGSGDILQVTLTNAASGPERYFRVQRLP